MFFPSHILLPLPFSSNQLLNRHISTALVKKSLLIGEEKLNSKRSFDNRKWKTGWIRTETGTHQEERQIRSLLKMFQYEKKVVYLQRQNVI
jgi:hypothetical protein